MGVSIQMTPGAIGRNFGKQVNITPGFRSQAASVLRKYFGEGPIVLVSEQDLDLIETLQDGASVYERDSIWKNIADALKENSAVTIVFEY